MAPLWRHMSWSLGNPGWTLCARRPGTQALEAYPKTWNTPAFAHAHDIRMSWHPGGVSQHYMWAVACSSKHCGAPYVLRIATFEESLFTKQRVYQKKHWRRLKTECQDHEQKPLLRPSSICTMYTDGPWSRRMNSALETDTTFSTIYAHPCEDRFQCRIESSRARSGDSSW